MVVIPSEYSEDVVQLIAECGISEHHVTKEEQDGAMHLSFYYSVDEHDMLAELDDACIPYKIII